MSSGDGLYSLDSPWCQLPSLTPPPHARLHVQEGKNRDDDDDKCPGRRRPPASACLQQTPRYDDGHGAAAWPEDEAHEDAPPEGRGGASGAGQADTRRCAGPR
jgi:hypothetical protein